MVRDPVGSGIRTGAWGSLTGFRSLRCADPHQAPTGTRGHAGSRPGRLVPPGRSTAGGDSPRPGSSPWSWWVSTARSWRSPVPTRAPAPPSTSRPGAAAGAKRVVPTQPSRPVDCRATPCVALTFDDGPVPETAEVVDVLAERGVRATFFVIGQQAKRYPEVLQRATRAGDEIGNHSWSHINLRSADAATVAKQLDRTSDVIEAATGVRPATMRPPYGAARRSPRPRGPVCRRSSGRSTPVTGTGAAPPSSCGVSSRTCSRATSCSCTTRTPAREQPRP